MHTDISRTTAVVGSLGGTTISLANFVPNTQSYQQISTTPLEYIAQIKQVVIPNPISGPGVYPEAVDTDFFVANSPGLPLKLFKQGINQPLILTNGLCQRNPIFFNETYTDIIYRKGKVILYEPGGAFKGIYNDAPGFSGSGSTVGFNPQICAAAAQTNNAPGTF